MIFTRFSDWMEYHCGKYWIWYTALVLAVLTGIIQVNISLSTQSLLDIFGGE
jgi:hypothetical protein